MLFVSRLRIFPFVKLDLSALLCVFDLKIAAVPFCATFALLHHQVNLLKLHKNLFFTVTPCFVAVDLELDIFQMGGSVSVNTRNLVIVTLIVSALVYFGTQLSPSGVSPVIGMIKTGKNWKDVDLKSQAFPAGGEPNVGGKQTIEVNVITLYFQIIDLETSSIKKYFEFLGKDC